MKGKPIVILLVEDDEAHATLIMRSLEDVSVVNKIFWVTDGEEALDYLFHRGKYADKKKAPQPDLILLDLRLPKINGHEVLKKIKETEELKIIPVVVLTTSDDEADMMKAYDSYVNSYLVKPVDFQKFRELINHIGFYWFIWNRHPWRDDD